MDEDFVSLLFRVASSDPSLVGLEIGWSPPSIPENRAELVQRVVAALATNTHVKNLTLFNLWLSETDIAPLAEMLKTRDFELLAFRGNNLTGEILFPALAERNSVRVLNLSQNNALKLEHLSALTNLKDLALGGCGFYGLPPALFRMSSLEALELGGNPLTTLPSSFASLSNLKQLDVRGCSFSTLPPVLLSLTQLESLDISMNRTQIPDGIAALVNLKTFVANYCGLTEFPIAITRLTRLEVLDLSDNRTIKRVPNDISNLRSLQELHLVRFGLRELPDVLWTLPNLKMLNLLSNPLTLLPGGIGVLSTLQQLSISDSQIHWLPKEMQQLSSLKVLHISSTDITHLPLWLASLRSLKELHCSASLLGVAMDDGALVEFGRLAALVSNSSDPETVRKRERSFEEMVKEDPLRLLRTANMHFAPRTPLRALCVSKCMAHHSRVELVRLPAHIRGEIERGLSTGAQGA